MPFFGLFWVNSWISCLVGYSQDLFKVPDYLTSALPARVLSVVGSPLENYNPLLVQAVRLGKPHTYNSSARGFDHSVAALPKYGFQPGLGRSLSPSNQSRPAFQATSWPDVLENGTCRPISEQKDNYQPVEPRLASQSASRIEESGRVESKPSLSQRILQVMQNLFQWSELHEASINPQPKPVVIVRTGDEEEADDTPENDPLVARRGFWRYSQMLLKRAAGVSRSPKEQWSQILVNGHLIAQVPDRVRAQSIAQNLRKWVASPYLDTSQLQPALVDGIPAGKLGDRVLFVIDEAISLQLDRNPHLLAIEWVNNLRTALGTAPLTLVQAQSHMYGLVETEKRIEGFASWYGDYFHGRPTATGEKFNQYALTAAHPSLPFDTYLKVINLQNGDAVIVRVNDRGPYVPPRSLDLSLGAARCINSEHTGVVPYEAVLMRSVSTR